MTNDYAPPPTPPLYHHHTTPPHFGPHHRYFLLLLFDATHLFLLPKDPHSPNASPQNHTFSNHPPSQTFPFPLPLSVLLSHVRPSSLYPVPSPLHPPFVHIPLGSYPPAFLQRVLPLSVCSYFDAGSRSPPALREGRSRALGTLGSSDALIPFQSQPTNGPATISLTATYLPLSFFSRQKRESLPQGAAVVKASPPPLFVFLRITQITTVQASCDRYL